MEKVEIKAVHRAVGIALLLRHELYESKDWQMFQVCTCGTAHFGIVDFHILYVNDQPAGASFAHPTLYKVPPSEEFLWMDWGQVYVKPEYRGRGYGKRLAEAIKVRPLRFNASELETVKNWPGRFLPEESTVQE